MQQAIQLGYWTGLRLTDLCRLLLSLPLNCSEALTWQANKTGKQHVWPIPDWLRPMLAEKRVTFPNVSHYSIKVIRRGIRLACYRAGVPVWTPQQLRQRAVNEWTRANATAGAIVHGQGINGAMRFYLDPLSVLEQAQYRVRLPESFGVTEDREEDIIPLIRRLDPSAQRLVVETAKRLAGT